jgi:hypothetical protein
MMRPILLFVLLCASPAAMIVAAQPQAVRPSAIATFSQRDTLLVADASQGRVLTVTLNDSPSPRETTIGKSLVDLARLADDRFVAVDRTLRQLILFRLDAGNEDVIHVDQRIHLDVEPARLAVNDVGTVACVTSRWSRAVQLVRLSETSRSHTSAPMVLGFEPQEILQLPNQRFLVADAFAGRLAVIDAKHHRVAAVQTIHGHNLRGLALTDDGSQVLISHQILSRVARSDVDDIHWGSLMQNVVSRFPIAALLRPPADFRRAVRRISLGDTGRGFADPTGVVALDDGFAVLSGGARQLSVHTNGTPIQYIDVGRRPTRLLLLTENRLAATNEHDGTISIVSLTDKAETQTIGLGAEGSFPVSAGEAAFYDAGLAHDLWMSCNSCHVDGHTPGLLADTLGDGSFGDAKLIPSLFGAKQTRPYGWLGNKPDLSSQIAATMASTMHAKDPPADVTATLVDFISGLELPTTAERADQVAEFGREVFKSRKCNECHQAPAFTSPLVRDVGLKDASGNAAFNPPSLRGLRHRRAFFHDGRAEALEQVFEVYHHQLNGDLSDEELRRLITYLKRL